MDPKIQILADQSYPDIVRMAEDIGCPKPTIEMAREFVEAFCRNTAIPTDGLLGKKNHNAEGPI